MTEDAPEREEVEDIEPPAISWEDKIAAMQEQLLRTAAELENTRRRSDRQLEDAAKYAVSSFAKDLVGVVDDFNRALQAIPVDIAAQDGLLKSLYEGVKMTERAMLALLQKHGVVEVQPEQGAPFDHNIHQAIAHLPSNDVEAGRVLEVMQKGYKLHDRLLRPAVVSVAKAASGSES